jgi:hypothetical protein
MLYRVMLFATRWVSTVFAMDETMPYMVGAPYLLACS